MRAVVRAATLALLTALVITACAGGPKLLSEETRDQFDWPILIGDGLEIPASWLLDEINTGPVWPQGGLLPGELVQHYWDSLVLDTLTGLAAVELPLQDYRSDYWVFRLRYYEYLAKEYINEKFRFQIVPDSQDIRDFYLERKQTFALPEQVNVSHILLSPVTYLSGSDSAFYGSLDSIALRDTIEATAQALYKRLKEGEPFDSIANAYSHDVITNTSGGVLGWTVRNTYVEPFDSVAFSLKPGEFSKPYRDRDGWHIIYVDDYIPEGPVALDREGMWDNVRDVYIETQTRHKTRLLLDSLYSNARFEFNEPVLALDPFNNPDSIWVAVVNGVDTIDFRHLRSREFGFRRRYAVNVTSPEMKREMVAMIAEGILLVQAAKAEGIDQRPRIRLRRDYLRAATAKSVLERQRFDPTWLPPDSAVRAYYDRHIEDYTVTKPLTLDQIVCNDEILAEYLYDLGNSGYDFPTLVEDYVPEGEGFEATYEELGDVAREDLGPDLFSTANGTRVGSVSEPVQTERGYHLIRVLDRRYSKSYDQARPSIITVLKKRYREHSIDKVRDSLIKRYNVTFPNPLPRTYSKNILDRT